MAQAVTTNIENWQAKLDKILHEQNKFTELLEIVEKKTNVRRLYIVMGEFYRFFVGVQLWRTTANPNSHDTAQFSHHKVSFSKYTFLGSLYYICSDVFPDAWFFVVIGCGQGLGHSGSIANSGFYTLVERPMFQSDVYRQAKIRAYTRYHDDIFFIAPSRDHALQVYNYMTSKSR